MAHFADKFLRMTKNRIKHVKFCGCKNGKIIYFLPIYGIIIAMYYYSKYLPVSYNDELLPHVVLTDNCTIQSLVAV